MVNQLRRYCLVSVFGIFAVGLMMGTASAAPVLPDFTVDLNPVSIPIVVPTLLVADKFTGNYNEVLTVTGPGTFATEAYWDAGQLVHDDGTIPYAAGVSKIGVDYAIYALFSSTGTFAVNVGGGFDFLATSGSVTLYLDQSVNTGKTLPATAPGAITRALFGDDSILATSPLFTGEGHTGSPLASGDFGLLFKPFTLTALGSSYFVSPVPFYMAAVLKGQFNSFVPAGTQLINGSADAFFDSTIPEPATLTLLGIGLVSSGLARRRRSKKA